MSQSVSFGSHTAWFPVVQSISAARDILTASQLHTQGIVSVVSNLSTPQHALFFSQTSPFAFLPHIGIFVSEFAMGSALSK
jgi:hypothetical protein